MKTKLILVLLTILCSLHINAQDTKQEVFTRIQKLADKAKGEKIKTDDVFSKKNNKLGKQVFTEKEVIVNTISEGKSDYERIKRATEIVWNDPLILPICGKLAFKTKTKEYTINIYYEVDEDVERTEIYKVFKELKKNTNH